MLRAARGLVLGCHPLPCLVVMTFSAALAAVVGATPERIVGVAAAILSGQLVVGWTNDLLDADRDVTAGRAEKPIAGGLVSRPVMAAAAAVAACACAYLSLRLGATAAALHLLALTSAVSYNAGLKGTPLSPVPYLVSFGTLPAIVTAAVDRSWPAPSTVIAAGLLGVAAHFGNTVGDAAADALTGVRGLPQRIGPERSLLAMALLVAAAAAVLLASVWTADAGAGRRAWTSTLLVAGVVLAVAGSVRHVGVPGGRSAFRLTLAAVTLVVTGFLATV